MKKPISMIIAAAITLSCFCSCGSSESASDKQETTTTKQTTEEWTLTAPTKASTSETTTTKKTTTTTTTKKTTTTTKKTTIATTPNAVDEDAYAGYAKILNVAKNNKPDVFAINYFVYDYDKDGIEELVIHYMTGARMGEIETYEYDRTSGEPILEAKGYCGSGIGYSKKLNSLMSSSVSNVAPLDKYPSGACVIILKLTVKNGEITYDAIADIEMNNPSESAKYSSDMQIDPVDKAITSSGVKANALHNRNI